MQANYDSLVHDINNSLLHFNAIIAPQTIVSHFAAVWHRLQKNKHYVRRQHPVILAALWSIMVIGRKSRANDLLTDAE